MKKFLLCFVFFGSVVAAQPQEDDGHLHGPDGRHIVASKSSKGGAEKFILSHHDMRIEGADGKIILGCKVDSKIYRKGNPADVIHTESNVYEAENEVYGSHMTYSEPGDYVLSQAVVLPGGKALSVDFPVFVPAMPDSDIPHLHGPNYVLIALGVIGVPLLLFGVYKLGQKSRKNGGAAILVLTIALCWSPCQMANAGGEALDPPKNSLKAFPTATMGASAEKVVEGVKFVLSIENEEMTPDPDLVAIGAEKAKLIGLKVVPVQHSSAGSGLQTSGQVSANPNGMVIVNARTAGRVVSLGALPGTSVSRGQTLAVIESPELAEAQSAYRRGLTEIAQSEAAIKIAQSEIGLAEARLSNAKQALARQKLLAASGEFAAPSVEAARSSLSKAEAAAVAAQTSVQALEVRVQRLEQGVATGVVARRELEVAQSELKTARGSLADATRQLTLSKQALAREESIASQGLRNAKEVQVAQGDVDVSVASLTASRNNLLQARADLARSRSITRVARDQIEILGGTLDGGHRITLTAPISGEVEHRFVSVGQTVAVGQELYDLLNAEVVWVLSDVYELDIPKVRIGQKVEVVADALPGQTYAGTVAFIHNEVDKESRTTKVRVVVDNPGEKLKQNMFVRVQLGTGTGNLMMVPTEAVQTAGGISVVFVEEIPGTYRRKIVQPGGTLGNRTIIESGLKLGDKVVSNGAYQLGAIVGAG